MPKRPAEYVTTRDILIPAGTRVVSAATRVSRVVPFASALVAVGVNSSAEWTMPLDEAIGAGLVTEIARS